MTKQLPILVTALLILVGSVMAAALNKVPVRRHPKRNNSLGQ
jgi:hypothetical protein